MKFEEVKLYNSGLLLFDIPDTIFLPLKKTLIEKNVNNNNNIKWNSHLAGQIENEYKLDCSGNLKIFLTNAAKKYFSHFESQPSETSFVLKSLWVNYQKKYEYNPIHIHTGSLSFIIFINIPFSFENEDNLSNTKSSMIHQNGRIMFTYQTFFHNMKTHTIDADSSYVGKMLMFPNTAHHTVYPFYTSDDYRITVSGNLDIVRD